MDHIAGVDWSGLVGIELRRSVAEEIEPETVGSGEQLH